MKSYDPETTQNTGSRRTIPLNPRSRTPTYVSGSPGPVTLHGQGVNPITIYFLKSPWKGLHKYVWVCHVIPHGWKVMAKRLEKIWLTLGLLTLVLSPESQKFSQIVNSDGAITFHPLRVKYQTHTYYCSPFQGLFKKYRVEGVFRSSWEVTAVASENS